MKKELLFSISKKDFKIDYFSGKGPGGQSRNKNQNCVRIRHEDSGAISTGQSYKSRKANIKEALNGIQKNPKFKMWLNLMIKEKLSGKSLDEIVEELMKSENLRIEVKDEDNKWKELLMNKKKKNVYTCQVCGGKIITVDRDEGTTPFMIECKVDENCKGDMYSSFYQVDQSLEPEFEWYRPDSLDIYPEEYREAMKEHIVKGGLDIRRIK